MRIADAEIKAGSSFKLDFRELRNCLAQKFLRFGEALSPSSCPDVKIEEDIIPDIFLKICLEVRAHAENRRNTYTFGTEMLCQSHKGTVFGSIGTQDTYI